jgi:hypothetical protein
MATYVWIRGGWRHKRSGEAMALPACDAVAAPAVQRDILAYRSPIDGRPITTRSERREDLKRNDCVEVEPRPAHRRGYRNPRFAGRRGLRLREHE